MDQFLHIFISPLLSLSLLLFSLPLPGARPPSKKKCVMFMFPILIILFWYLFFFLLLLLPHNSWSFYYQLFLWVVFAFKIAIIPVVSDAGIWGPNAPTGYLPLVAQVGNVLQFAWPANHDLWLVADRGI